MAMKRCPECGEKYSDTYKYCPFCEEEEYLKEEKTTQRMGRHAKHSISPVTLILIFLIAVLAVLLIHLLKGIDKPVNTPATPPKQEQVETPVEQPENPADAETPVDTPVDTPDEPSAVVTPSATLNREDMTLSVGESFRLELDGTVENVSWTSSDEAIATVSNNGTVTAMGGGICMVQAAWDGQSVSCVVRVKGASANTTTPTAPVTPTTPSVPQTPSTPSTPTTTGLSAGNAKVSVSGSGVYVRSGPGTNYEALASLSNGASVKVVKSVGDGWYEISFANSGGRMTTGYMKGDFLVNS